MKFWRNAAALLTVFRPETTHTGNHSTPKDVKNEGRPGYVYENKWTTDKMSEIISAICARSEPFLKKIGISSSPNSSKVPQTYRTAGGAESLVLRLCGFSQTELFLPPMRTNSQSYSLYHVSGDRCFAAMTLTSAGGVWVRP